MPPLPPHHALSAMDEMLPPIYYSYLLCFPFDSTNDSARKRASQRFRTATRKLVSEAPYLVAEIRRSKSLKAVRNGHLYLQPLDNDPRLNARYPSIMTMNDLSGPESEFPSYEKLKSTGMSPQTLDAKILSYRSAGVEPSHIPFGMQINYIPGGLILALQFHHDFSDAQGACTIANRLAELTCEAGLEQEGWVTKREEESRPDCKNNNCLNNGCGNIGPNPELRRGLPSSSASAIPCTGSASSESSETSHKLTLSAKRLSIDSIQQAHNFSDLKDDADLWKLNALDPSQQPPTGQSPLEWPEYLPSLLPMEPSAHGSTFCFTPTALTALKELASTSAAESGGVDSWISRQDALTALIWRHVLRARYPSGQDCETTNAVVALDGRKELGIPTSHIGNVIFHTFTPMAISEVRGDGDNPTPLSKLASSIRATIRHSRDTELLGRAAGLAGCIPDVSALRYGSDNLGKDVYLTSWLKTPFYSMDWGTGLNSPEVVRIPDNHFQGLVCVLPPRPMSGIVDVVISMHKEAGERLRQDTEFTKFAKPVEVATD